MENNCENLNTIKVKGFYCRSLGSSITEFYYFCPFCGYVFSVMEPCCHYERSEPPKWVHLKVKLTSGGEEMANGWDEFERYLIETRYAVREPVHGKPLEVTWDSVVNRLLGGVESRVNESRVNESIDVVEIIDKAVRGRYIIPATPFLMSFGNSYTRRKGYFSCYPLGYVGDSMEEIYQMAKWMMQVYVCGGGVGIDVSKLRPRNSLVDDGQGCASGPVGFLSLFDVVTGTTNQGGRRRGALLVQMDWRHPDVVKFIRAKNLVPALSAVIYGAPEEDRIDVPLQNMNISVVVDEEFWEKGERLLGMIAEGMWRSGDPGLLFLDNMRRYSPFNPNEYGSEHDPRFSNPCGEYLAPAGTACNLLTVNVAKIARECLDGREFDFDRFFRAVAEYARQACLLGSFIVELDEGYPLAFIRDMTKRVRPVGIGMTGLHSAMLLAYDGDVVYGRDDEAVEFAEKTQCAITVGSLFASVELAKRFGKVYKWNPEFLRLHLDELREVVDGRLRVLKEMMDAVYEEGMKMGGFYNAVTTSQPPTGSVSQFARVGGDTGIEPMYAVELQRRVRDFGSGKWKEVVVVTEWIRDRLEDREFRKKVERQLAYEIKPAEQLRMLEAIQKFVHTGISKTVNVPRETTVEEIEGLIRDARKMRLKGFTVFREGCRVDTVYVSPREKEGVEEELSPVREAFVYEVKGPMTAYVTTTLDESKRVREVFISVGKAGTTLNGMFQAFGRVMSVALRRYPELIDRFVETLEGIETGEFYRCGEIVGKSLPDVIAKILKCVVNKDSGKESNDVTGDVCPKCGRMSFVRNGGCKTCRECGHSVC